MNEDYIIEKVEKGPEGETREKTYYHSAQGLDLKTKLKLIAFLIVGVAVGTLLFLFFVTLFIYFFIPLVILFALWSFFRRGR